MGLRWGALGGWDALGMSLSISAKGRREGGVGGVHLGIVVARELVAAVDEKLRAVDLHLAPHGKVSLREGLHRAGVDAARPVDELRRVPVTIGGTLSCDHRPVQSMS